MQLIEVTVNGHTAHTQLLSEVVNAHKTTLVNDLSDEAEPGGLRAWLRSVGVG